MAELLTKLRLDNSEFNNNIESAKQKTEQFQKTADDTNKSLKEMGDKGSRSAKELLAEMNNLANSGRATTNYRRQLKEIQNTLNDLTISYRQMTDEMKQSPIGQEVAGKITELTQKAAEYKDAINDVQKEIQNMASDTAVWDGMKQGVMMVSSALQAFVAAGVLGEEQTEKLVKVIAKLKAIETVTNAVIRVGNALQKDSEFRTGLATIATKLNTKAKIANTAATGAQTAAQKGLNKALMANPYVLIAAAIAAVTIALIKYTRQVNAAREEEKKHAEEVKKLREEQNEYRNDVSNNYAQLMSKYSQLRREWRQLSTESQKVEWIKKNKQAFEDLGLSINNINSAEKTFVDNNKEVIDGFRKRAQAAAYATRMTNLYSQQMDVMEQAQQRYNEKRVSAYTVLPSTYAAKQSFTRDAGADTFNNGKYGMNNQGQYYFTAKGAAEYNRELFKTDKILVDLSEKYEDINKKLDDAEKKLEQLSKGIGGTTVVTSDKPIINEIELLKEKKQKLEEEKRYIKQGTQEWYDQLWKINEVDQQIKEMEQDAKDYTDSLNWDPSMIQKIEKPVENVIGSLAEANTKIRELQDLIENLDPNTDEFKTVLSLLDAWKKRQQEINDLINHAQPDTIVDKYRNIVSQANDIEMNLRVGAIDKKTAKAEVEKLNKSLQDLGLEIHFAVSLDGESIDMFNDKLSEMAQISYESTINVVNSFNSVYESVKNLNDTLGEAKNGWEAFFAVFQTGVTIIDAVANAIQSVSTVSEMLNLVTEAGTNAKIKNTAASAASATAAQNDATAQTSDATATLGNAAAHGAAAATKAGESAAVVPIAGAILAPLAIIATLAAVIAAIGSLSKFADGGIVNGHSYTGDKILARVNSGEMILNQKQQDTVWKMMNNTETVNNQIFSGDVNFKIKGSDLVGVFNNYNKKMNKV